MKKVCLHLDQETIERLDRACDDKLTVRAKLVRKAVNEYLDKMGVK